MVKPMEHKDYRLAAVMFTDIVGFSRMMEEDEKGTLQTLDFHNTLVREQVGKFRGSVIKTIGDAFLAQFSTTLDAVECSLAVQEGIHEYNDAKLGKPLSLRVGVHLGDIYFYENDALGEGINIASRLQSLTKPGHITISREVYSQVSGRIAMRVESLGQVHLKNITREVHAYEIIPGGEDNNSVAARKALLPEAAEPAPPEPSKPQSPPEPQSAPPPRGTIVPPEGYRSFRDMRDEWTSLKDIIKEQVKTAAETGQWHAMRHQLRHEIQNTRRRERHRAHAMDHGFDPMGMVDQFLHDPLDDLKNPDGTSASALEIYKQKVLRGARHGKGGLAGHLIPYVGVNAMLILINQLTFSGFQWWVFPFFGWGVGVVSHITAYKTRKKAVDEVEQVDSLSDEDLKTLKQFHHARTGFYVHAASNAAVALLLLVAGLVTHAFAPGAFQWPWIPIAGIAVGVFSHLPAFLNRREGFRSLWKRLKHGEPSKNKPAAAPVSSDPVVGKAQGLRDSIVAQAQSMKGGHPFGDDMTLTLDNYVRQIGELSAIERELGQVVSSFSTLDLEAEEASIRAKIEKTRSDTLKTEYEKSLAEIEKQRKSFGDLAEQQEILVLRIKSAVGNLQQMQIDLARIKGLSDGQKEGSFLSIKDRSEELSRYIEDYREGLKEVPS
jgi:class 3 adenylate cyclase